MQPRLHRAVGQPGDLADLLDRQILDVAQHHDDALIVIEVGDRLLEQDLQLRALQRAIGLRVARWAGGAWALRMPDR